MAPVPPPPPAPAPAPVLQAGDGKGQAVNLPNRSALLKSIEKGAKLKKTATNDRSAPLVANKPAGRADDGGERSTGGTQTMTSQPMAGIGAGLFSNGFPKLRSVNGVSSSNPSASSDKTPRSVTKPTSSPAASTMSNTKLSAAQTANAVSNTKLAAAHVASAMAADMKPKDLAKTASQAKSVAKMAAPIVKQAALPATSAVKSRPLPKPPTEALHSVTAGMSQISMSSKAAPVSPAEKWEFPANVEDTLPRPRKFTGSAKVYLSRANKTDAKIQRADSRSTSLVSKQDVADFITGLRAKLKTAAADEKFEECVRLKSKLRALEDIQGRIASGESVSSSELP